MKRHFLASCLLAASLLWMPASASAASYSFQVTREQVDAYWNTDGTLALDYLLIFQNEGGAHPIDYVDVGMPNASYDLSSATASVDGHRVNVTVSDVVDPGVTVDMGEYTIPAGGSGSVQLHIGRVSSVLFMDDNDPNLASAVFSPSWFDSQYVNGSTDLTVVFHLPSGVQPDEPRYHQPQSWPGASEPSISYDKDNRITYTWHSAGANGYTQYTFGASFPGKLVPADAIRKATFLDRISGLLAALSVTFTALMPCICILGSLGFVIGISVLSYWADNRRKKQYLPPKISIEGHGIKRGLTAVEAAMLMEQPLDKVMTMILFAVVKKNAASVTTREPLALNVVQPISDQLNPYEADFLNAFLLPTQPARRKALQELTVKLINSLTEKMKGFSRKETVTYYQQIMEQAWKQVTAAGTPEVKAQAMDDGLEWTMLDNNFPDRSRSTWGPSPVFMPIWWGRYDPHYGGQTAAPVPHMGSLQMPSVSLPHLPGADFAASVVGGVQNFSQGVIGDLTSFTGNVTNRTNPVPVSTSSHSGYSGGGGHSCACACACAGCACACAGGGR
jgi:hypothetical protein